MRISKQLLEKIKEHGSRAYPEECCGVLLGNSDSGQKSVTEIIEIENAHQDGRERRFLITPQAYVEAEKIAKSKGVEIVGFYHSHPDHPAAPSQFDLEHAWAWFSYLITRVERREAKECTAWILRDDRMTFERETVEVIDH